MSIQCQSVVNPCLASPDPMSIQRQCSADMKATLMPIRCITLSHSIPIQCQSGTNLKPIHQNTTQPPSKCDVSPMPIQHQSDADQMSTHSNLMSIRCQSCANLTSIPCQSNINYVAIRSRSMQIRLQSSRSINSHQMPISHQSDIDPLTICSNKYPSKTNPLSIRRQKVNQSPNVNP